MMAFNLCINVRAASVGLIRIFLARHKSIFYRVMRPPERRSILASLLPNEHGSFQVTILHTVSL